MPGATPNLALPYPLATEPVSQGDDAIKALADNLDALLGGGWTTYVPVWTGTGSNPVLGNGTLTGRYKKVGWTVHYYISLVMGSTTTYGGGRWDITLPAAAAPAYSDLITPLGVAHVRDAGTRNYAGLAMYSTPNKVHAWRDGGASEAVITPTTPMTWTTFDILTLSGTYEAAA